MSYNYDLDLEIFFVFSQIKYKLLMYYLPFPAPFLLWDLSNKKYQLHVISKQIKIKIQPFLILYKQKQSLQNLNKFKCKQLY